jgi:diguanylate cyclase (GGDEF)-like protein
MRTARRLKELVIAEAIPHEKSEISEIITVSQGVVTVRPDANLAPSEVVKWADEALYQAKDDGRNAISVSSSGR